MRRALVQIPLALGVLAMAAQASAQVYDRYGGGAVYGVQPAYPQAPSRVLNWTGKQTQPAPQMAAPPAQMGYGYPQAPYPQMGYPQAGYAPQAGYGYPQQGYYPSMQPSPQQAGYPQAQPQPGALAPGQMPSYEQMQQQRAAPQMAGPPQPFPIMSTPPQGAWAYQPGTYPQQPYPQQAYPQQAYPQAQPYAAPAAYAQPQAQPYAPGAYPQPQPGMTDPAVTAAPTTPVQSAPLPTNIYAPANPRADIQPGMPSGLPLDSQGQPSGGGGSTALASLDTRSLPASDGRNPGVRHYSVHRPFGMSPDPAPSPSINNQVLIAQAPEAEMIDSDDVGLRGVGMEQEAKSSSQDD